MAETAPAFTIRPLGAADLADVVAIDAALEGRSRRAYVDRRLQAAQREPALHAQFAAQDADGLAGYMLARVLAGEFGRRDRRLQLELIGVRGDRRAGGIGQALFETLAGWCARHGCREIVTAASWRAGPILGWLDARGFALAPDLIVDCAVDGGAWHLQRDAARPDAVAREIDYSRDESNDHERLARDEVDVRTMTPADVDAIVRIDRSITGHDRRAYIEARLAEATQASGVRVSLAARCEGAVAGYLMARADLGDFGRTEPVAVIDTIGVDPDLAHHGVGRALLSQLFANLGALRVERVETVVPQQDLALLGFLYACGFAPSQRLSFVRRLDSRSPP